MAGTTGLEPATSAVTGQRSNQLSYVPSFFSSTYAKSKNLLSIAAVYLISRFHSAINGQQGQHEILPSMPLQATRNPEHLSMSRDSNCTKRICSLAQLRATFARARSTVTWGDPLD